MLRKIFCLLMSPENQKVTATKFMENEIDPFIKKCEYQVNFNRVVGVTLILAGIGLGVGITLSGIYGNSKLAATLGAFSAGVQAASGFFPFEKRVWFYRTSVAEAQKMKSLFKYEYEDNYSLKKAIGEFENLRTKTLAQEPLNSIPDSVSPNTVTDNSSAKKT